jgi:hypothetical protein
MARLTGARESRSSFLAPGHGASERVSDGLDALPSLFHLRGHELLFGRGGARSLGRGARRFGIPSSVFGGRSGQLGILAHLLADPSQGFALAPELLGGLTQLFGVRPLRFGLVHFGAARLAVGLGHLACLFGLGAMLLRVGRRRFAAVRFLT